MEAGSIPDDRPPLAGIILAGGASVRMGTPKALLRAPGDVESFLDRLIGLLGGCCAPVIVVLGHEAETIRAGAARAPEARFVVNHRHQEGQLSSLQCGLGAVPSNAAGAMFVPVDFPAIRPATVARLAAAFQGADAPLLVIPRYAGKRGHPVCVRRPLFQEFLALPPGAQARDVVRRHDAEACYVEVDDPGVLRDVDDPQAYRELLESARPQ